MAWLSIMVKDCSKTRINLRRSMQPWTLDWGDVEDVANEADGAFGAGEVERSERVMVRIHVFAIEIRVP